MLSRQLQAEEQKHLVEHIKQIENKRSFKYQCNQMRDEIIPYPPSPNRYNDDQSPAKCDSEGLKIQNSQDPSKGKQT